MEINWPGEKLLLKLCDTVGNKGIGALLKPWQMRREGAAAAEIKRLNTLTVAQTKIEVADIQAGKKILLPNGKLSSVKTTSPEDDNETAARFEIIAELEKVVEATVQREAFRKEISVAKAVLYAEQELEQDTQPATEEPVSDDWLFRWRDNAAAVSSDELQNLWGKVLAGEVKSPGSYSLRTLDFLKNLSREDASLIERIAPFVISSVVFRPTGDNELGNLTFSEILELQEIGILFGVEAVGMLNEYSTLAPDTFTQSLTCHGRLILVKHAEAGRKFSMEIYGVTKIGREVLNLGWKKADESYLRSNAEKIKALGFDVSIGDYTKLEGNLIRYFNMIKV